MKKKILAMVLSMAMAVTMLPATSVRAESSEPVDTPVTLVDEGENTTVSPDDVGQYATVSSSGSTWDRNMESIKDANWEPIGNIGDQSEYVPEYQGWGNWGMDPSEEGYYYVQYDWPEAFVTNCMQLYWFCDNPGGLGAPEELTVLYKDVNGGAEWKEATMITDFSEAKKLGEYNEINFEEISTKSIRLAMHKSASYGGIGICRWKVMASLSDEDKDKLSVSLPERVRDDFPLPAETAAGKVLVWESSNTDVITVDGTMAKVESVSATTDVTMTAKVGETVFKTFTVKVLAPIDLATVTVPGYPYSTEYNGQAQWPKDVGSVDVDGVTLVERANYMCSGTFSADPVNAGEKTVILTAIEGDKLCTGSKTVTYTITPKALIAGDITLEQEEYNYQGTSIEPVITVTDTNWGWIEGEWGPIESTLVKDTDYTVSYSNNTTPGAGTVTVEGKGNYGGTIQKSFSIIEAGKTSIGEAEVTLEKDVYLETEEAIEPGITSVVLGETALIKDTDYTVSYMNNGAAGTATVVITGNGAYTGSVSKTFTILKDLNKAEIVLTENGIYEYTGLEISPVIETVTYNGEDVRWSVHWLPIMPERVVNPGTYQIGITSEGLSNNPYGGSKTINFKVVKTLTEEDVTLAQTEYTYEGTPIEPGVTVKVTIKDEDGTTDVEKTLVKDTDYTVDYKDNNIEGTGTVTVKGIGNYAGTVNKTFTITEGSGSNKIDMSNLTVTFPNDGKYEYTGAEIQPMATVKDGDTPLLWGSGFNPVYPEDMTSVGLKTVTINPGSDGKYKNSKEASYEIKARTLTSDNTAITLTMPENIVAGTQVKPEVSVKVTVSNYAYEWYPEEGGPETLTYDLVKGTDYTVEYGANNTEGAEAGTVTITGTGNYAGSVEKKFAIGTSGPVETKTDLKDAVVTIPDCTYNKNAQTPEVTVKVGEKTLEKDTDYTVSYENNTNAGTAKAVITAKESSDYTGSKEQNFTINKANAVITAKNITKTIGEKDFSFGAKVDSNGTLSYTSNKTKVIKVVKGKAQIVNAGTANITIKAAATANYNEATKTITIRVNKLKKATLSKVESKKSGQLKVTWKKDAKAAGYKVMYSTDKKFKNKKVTKTITVKKNKTVSKTIKKLKKGKKYYVKVCSYVKVGKKEVLGSYSKVKSVKVKK